MQDGDQQETITQQAPSSPQSAQPIPTVGAVNATTIDQTAVNSQQATSPPEPQVSSEVQTTPDASFESEPEASATLASISSEPLSWTASEFIAHQKSFSWYLWLGVGAVILAGLIWLIAKDIVSAIVVLGAAAAFGYFANRSPRQLSYNLDKSILTIGAKQYSLDTFRSFSIMPENAFTSISLMPLKRFAPILSIYYSPENEQQIVTLLSGVLPFEERNHDPIDQLMRRVRF